MFFHRMQKEHQRLQNHILYIKEQLAGLPDGKLTCCHDGAKRKWYQSDGHTRSYIPKSNSLLAEQLAYKKVLTCQLEDYLKEKRALEFYLKHHPSDYGKAEHFLETHPGFQELISNHQLFFKDELNIWQNEPFHSNMSYSEQLIHKSISGHILRSKSESMIDHFLFTYQIPFRYECALDLGNTTIFPDFTIRHPDTGEIYYWEHFGLMDDPNYARKTFSKIQLYNNHGIIPGIQLITTFETQQHPLTTECILKTIEYYFL